MPLPPFLQPLVRRDSPTVEHHTAIFQHKHPFGRSHALWWNSQLPLPTTVILFIPGNPGLLDFYIPFLNSIYARDTTLSLAIFAYSHIGHTPGIDTYQASQHGLPAQVEGSIEAFDAVRSEFDVRTRIVIVGHSVGAWLALQVLKARSTHVAGVFLLFPTISHMRDTTNGRRLSWVFSLRMRTCISRLSYLTRILPVSVLALLFSAWPYEQVAVLRTLLHSPSSILAALHMADDEMHTIRDLDSPLLATERDKLWFYFAQKDEWVGGEMKHVLDSFNPELEHTRIVHGHQDIPHAFCINHGEDVAGQCHEWLNTLNSSF